MASKREAAAPKPKKKKPAPGRPGRPRTGNAALNLNSLGEPDASHAHLDHAYQRFIEDIDESDLHSALVMDKQKKMQTALLMLTHPAYVKATRRDPNKPGLPGGWSTAAVLKKAGVTLPELMEVYGRYRVSQAVRIAMDRTPKIMTHTADDAENRQVVCPRCDGFGTLDIEQEEDAPKRQKALIRTCPECNGLGTITQSGDAEARKLIFEVAGIAGKKGPVVDARQLHIGTGFSVESSVKEMESWDEPLALAAASNNSNSEVILDAEEVTE